MIDFIVCFCFVLFFVCYIHRSGVLTALAWLVLHETAAVSAQVLCTPYNHAPCHFKQSHIPKVYACLAVTCHLHFWQNDRDFLHATVVIRGWNGYRNKSQHRKSTLEKKILPPFQQGFEPATFQSESGALTTELSPPHFRASLKTTFIPRQRGRCGDATNATEATVCGVCSRW